MTEPFRPDDDLVSAVLDGEATPEERARVETDPALRARLEEFRRAAALVATPPSASAEAAREAALARAGAEHGRRLMTGAAPAGRPHRSTPRLLAVAAAVLLVVLVGGLVVTRLGDDAGTDTAASGGGADATEAADETATADSVFAGGAAGRLDLGDVAGAEALITRLVDEGIVSRSAPASALGDQPASETEVTSGAVPGDSEGCEVRLEEADPALAGLLTQGTVVYAGEPAVFYVFATDEGPQRVVVVSDAACAVLAAVTP